MGRSRRFVLTSQITALTNQLTKCRLHVSKQIYDSDPPVRTSITLCNVELEGSIF